MRRVLCIILIISSVAYATFDRSIFPIGTRNEYRTLTDNIFGLGSGTGQMLYWDGSNWTNTTTPPAADRMSFWDNSESTVSWLEAGQGLQIITTTLSNSYIYPLATKVTDYTATTSDYTILVDTNSGNVTITLPAAASNTGRVFVIKCIDATNTCDIDPNGTEEIDGDNSNFELILHETIMIQSDGSNWWII